MARVHCGDGGRCSPEFWFRRVMDFRLFRAPSRGPRFHPAWAKSRLWGLGWKHQDDPINAGVTVAFQHLQVSGRPEDVEGERRGIAAGILCHLSELRQHLERIQRTPADGIEPSPEAWPVLLRGEPRLTMMGG